MRGVRREPGSLRGWRGGESRDREGTQLNVRPEDLEARLAHSLAQVYIVHGDEPLIALECGDAIRAAARRYGVDERETFIVEQHFKWDALLAAKASMAEFRRMTLILVGSRVQVKCCLPHVVRQGASVEP